MWPGRWRKWSFPFIAASLLIVACGDDPPDPEIQQAQTAIDAARAADASTYAHDDLTAAEQALAAARKAVTDRDYRLALTNALESRERAQAAAKDAGERKAAARQDVERTMRTVTGAVAQTRARLKTAEGARGASRLAAAKRAVDDADRAVQEARTAFDANDYSAAKAALDTANARLAVATRDVEPPAKPPGRARR
jgi:hypothetical protein